MEMRTNEFDEAKHASRIQLTLCQTNTQNSIKWNDSRTTIDADAFYIVFCDHLTSTIFNTNLNVNI